MPKKKTQLDCFVEEFERVEEYFDQCEKDLKKRFGPEWEPFPKKSPVVSEDLEDRITNLVISGKTDWEVLDLVVYWIPAACDCFGKCNDIHYSELKYGMYQVVRDGLSVEKNTISLVGYLGREKKIDRYRLLRELYLAYEAQDDQFKEKFVEFYSQRELGWSKGFLNIKGYPDVFSNVVLRLLKEIYGEEEVTSYMSLVKKIEKEKGDALYKAFTSPANFREYLKNEGI